MKFADFRAPAKALLVLVCIGIVVGTLQVVLYPPTGPVAAIARLIDIPLAFFILYGIFTRLKLAYWLLVVSNSLSLLSLALRIGLATRIGGLNVELIATALLYNALPVVMLILAFSYGVRRHFRLIESQNEKSA